MAATEFACNDDGAARHDGGAETDDRTIHVGEGQHCQTTVSWRKPVARADVICRPGDLILIQNHAFCISGGAGGHEADIALYRWEWRDTLGARLLDQCITVSSGDDLSSKSGREALRFFVLFHKQHVWPVHTDRSCAFFLCGIRSQGNEHVPSSQSTEPEHRVGNPP